MIMTAELIDKKIGSTRSFYTISELKDFLKQRKAIAFSYDERREIDDLLLYKNEYIERVECIEGTYYEIQVFKD